MWKTIVIILLSITIASCAQRVTLIDRSNVRSISISLVDSSGQKAKNISIVNYDSLDRIIAALNGAVREPIYFWPRHRLEVIYKTGKKLMIGCDSSAVMIDGFSFRMRLNIKDIVGF
jgi:hypothetical protein